MYKDAQAHLREREREHTSREITASKFLSSSTSFSVQNIRLKKAFYQIGATQYGEQF